MFYNSLKKWEFVFTISLFMDWSKSIGGGVGWSKKKAVQQFLSLGKGVGHFFFEPLEGVGHDGFLTEYSS